LRGPDHVPNGSTADAVLKPASRSRIGATLLDAETGERDYLFTGCADHPEPFETIPASVSAPPPGKASELAALKA
jgi:hypothetical protein